MPTSSMIVRVFLAVACLGLFVAAQGAEDAKIARIEAAVVDMPMGGNEPPLRLDLLKLMQAYKVPGLSFAVIDDFKVVFAKGYGVVEQGSKAPVTTKTLFQAGSISKPVAAAGALYLVEQGKLSLDENVNVKLKTWKVPDNEFTKSEKVTLRRLMSHTAGLTVHGFPGYDVTDPLPTMPQIFNGEKPANTAPIRVDIVPGTQVRYSGGGVTIEQQVMIDVTGKAFPALLKETVLDKAAMTDSSYEQPLPAARASAAASGTYADGKVVRGKWHIYPEMAAAGLWTTPTDLCKFAIEIALSKTGKSNRILSQDMTRRMLTPVMDESRTGLLYGEGQSWAVRSQWSGRGISGATHDERGFGQGRGDHGLLGQRDCRCPVPAAGYRKRIRLELQEPGTGRLADADTGVKVERHPSSAAAIHGTQSITFNGIRRRGEHAELSGLYAAAVRPDAGCPNGLQTQCSRVSASGECVRQLG